MIASVLRARAAGWLLASMVLLVPLHGLGVLGSTPAAVPGWLAVVLLWSALSLSQRRQVMVLAGLGMAGLVFAASRGVTLDPARILLQNHLILSMLAAVSFLRLV